MCTHYLTLTSKVCVCGPSVGTSNSPYISGRWIGLGIVSSASQLWMMWVANFEFMNWS